MRKLIMQGAEDWLYRALGREWCGMTGPPGDNLSLTLKGSRWYGAEPKLCEIREGGRSLWIFDREEDRAVFHMDAFQAVPLAWFILWRWWVLGTWFGLRRAIWYRLLSRSLARTRIVIR